MLNMHLSHLLIVIFVAFPNSCDTVLKFYFSVVWKYGLTPNINGRDQITPRFDWLTRRRSKVFLSQFQSFCVVVLLLMMRTMIMVVMMFIKICLLR